MKQEYINIFLAVLIAGLVIWLMPFMLPMSQSQTYTHEATVNTTVNITNSAPIVNVVKLLDPIVLTAYDTTIIDCNVTVYDYDNDTVTLNATLHYYNTDVDAADDDNNQYTNISCTLIDDTVDTIRKFRCTFPVEYFANNGTWYCNATALDDDNAHSSNDSIGSTLQPLVAIYVPGIIDYGDLAQGETSGDIGKNITNVGNRDINISVEGWGAVQDDGWAMNCTFGHIEDQWERYNVSTGSGYDDMLQIDTNLNLINGFGVTRRLDDAQESYNTTYWKLQVPVGAGGVCNGKVLFSASDAGP